MLIGGLDFSITSPSICIYNSDKDTYNITSWTQIKSKQMKKTKVNNFTFESIYIERTDSFYFDLSDEISKRIKKLDYLGIEQYAFSGSGKLTVLAEVVGIIKYNFYKAKGYKITEVSIPQGKMCANRENKGNVGKYTNIYFFINNYVPKLLEKTIANISDETPLSDWVDSFGICNYVIYLYKYNNRNTEDIPEKILEGIRKKNK
jgi:hypothetical protein